MSVGDWLSARAPEPPPGLMPWLASDDEAGAVGDALRTRGLAALDHARAAPGRMRDSAWWLLAADALVTYACEAALEEDAPEASLERLLVDVSSAGR